MNDRDCDNCAHHTGGSCSVWECSYEPIEDDLISRKAAIDCLCNGKCTEEVRWCDDGDCMPVRRINSLPSAQPEIAENLYLCKCYITDKDGLQHEVIHTDDIRRVTGWEI